MRIRTPKTSSATRSLLRRIGRTQTVEEARKILSGKNRKVVSEFLDVALTHTRRRLLLELANLHDEGLVRFQKAWGERFDAASPQEIFELRDELQQIWDRQTSLDAKHEILDGWLRLRAEGFRRFGYREWTIFLPGGRLLPHFRNLRTQLLTGVLEQYWHFATCGNPSCPVPYFLARRRDQKYCERGDCTEYAQRQHALKWWRREGDKRRRRRLLKKSKVARGTGFHRKATSEKLSHPRGGK